MVLNCIDSSTITAKGQIVIPAGVRAREGFKTGQKIAILEFDDHLELRPMKEVLSKIDFRAERKRTSAALKKFAFKHNLRGRKIKELTPEEKGKLAIGIYERTRLEKNSQ